jgi:arylsulfatase A-like enzyme
MADLKPTPNAKLLTTTLAAAITAALLAAPAATARENEAQEGAQTQKGPNIVVIVADDLGHGDIASYGGDVPTPRIDSIAQGGVRFTAGYVTAPVCNPSRAGLMSGRYQQRWGQEFNYQTATPDGAPRSSLPQVERTLGSAMKAQGYTTGAIGKWHLGMQPGYHPLDRGFDEFFGMASGTRYVDRSWPNIHVYDGLTRFDRSQPPGDSESDDPVRNARRGLFRGREDAPLEEYVTDQLAKEAVAFIDRHRAEPFFLYVAFNAPHAPLETTDPYYQRVPQFSDERKRIHAAMIVALDDGVGRILDRLQEIGVAENTLVVFTSDNGGPEVTDADGRCNAPYVGHKRNLYEGGIRLPYMIRWPARVRAGATFTEMVSTLDLFPTLLAAAGAKPDADAARPLDGVDLLPFIARDAKKDAPEGAPPRGAPHESLFWRSGANGAVRQGRYKLIFGGAPSGGAPSGGNLVRLYDLERDPKEANDLSASMPDRVTAMRKAWDAWNAQLSPARTSGRTEDTTINGDTFRWGI